VAQRFQAAQVPERQARGGVLSMATKSSGPGDKNKELNDATLETDPADFEVEPDVVPPVLPVSPKDPMIRRKIEDRLERIRLREQLGIYDDDQWRDL
jgi:hypothetical protein